MTNTLKFYTNPMSRGQIARWALHEAGAGYEQVLLEYGGSMKDADFLAINPMGKVPAIMHGDKVVTEAAAICAYLAEVFPEAGLAPRAGEHADYYRWMFFAAGPVEAAVVNNNMQWIPSEEQQRMLGYGDYERVVNVLEELFSGRDFVCGDRFTAADIYVGSQIDWGLQFETMPKLDVFEAYANRLRDRAAYQKAKEIDAKLIADGQG
ncbi:MAG: glutathione S-transferase family protein [Candidatus Azotimanducaceae bacterium WSBS_2022_MAG_OTU7]